MEAGPLESETLQALLRLTHVLANVLNLNDRSIPCPSAVSAHRPPDTESKGDSASLTAVVSEPSAKLGCAAMLDIQQWLVEAANLLLCRRIGDGFAARRRPSSMMDS